MAKRTEVLKFGKLNGLQVKGERLTHNRGFVVTAYCPKTEWVDCFDSWEQTHDFFLQAVNAHKNQSTSYPWDKAR